MVQPAPFWPEAVELTLPRVFFRRRFITLFRPGFIFKWSPDHETEVIDGKKRGESDKYGTRKENERMGHGSERLYFRRERKMRKLKEIVYNAIWQCENSGR